MAMAIRTHMHPEHRLQHWAAPIGYALILTAITFMLMVLFTRG